MLTACNRPNNGDLDSLVIAVGRSANAQLKGPGCALLAWNRHSKSFPNQSSSSNLTRTPGLALVFASPLTNAGGTDNIGFGQEALCNNSTCSTPVGTPDS
jgi:hypothetical protein